MGFEKGRDISDDELIDNVVLFDEFYRQYGIEFVEYDERVYEFCKQANAENAPTARNWYDFADQHALW